MKLKSFWLFVREAERGDDALQATQDGGWWQCRQGRTQHHTTIKHSKWERGQKDGVRDTGDAMDEKRIIKILVCIVRPVCHSSHIFSSPLLILPFWLNVSLIFLFSPDCHPSTYSCRSNLTTTTINPMRYSSPHTPICLPLTLSWMPMPYVIPTRHCHLNLIVACCVYVLLFPGILPTWPALPWTCEKGQKQNKTKLSISCPHQLWHSCWVWHPPFVCVYISSCKSKSHLSCQFFFPFSTGPGQHRAGNPGTASPPTASLLSAATAIESQCHYRTLPLIASVEFIFHHHHRMSLHQMVPTIECNCRQQSHLHRNCLGTASLCHHCLLHQVWCTRTWVKNS